MKRKKRLCEEISKLNNSILRCTERIEDVANKQKYLYRLSDEVYKGRLYRKLPLCYANTVYQSRKELLRKHNNDSMQEPEGVWCEPAIKEKAGSRVAVHCDSYEVTENGIIFTFSDPYNQFTTEPMNITVEKAATYKDRMLFLVISSCYIDNMVAYDNALWKKTLSKVEKKKYIPGVYKVTAIKETKLGLYGVYGEKIDDFSHPLLRFAWQYRDVASEADAVEAINDIQNYARLENYLVERFSPMEVRVIDRNSHMYSFYMEEGRMYYIEEEKHTRSIFDAFGSLEESYFFEKALETQRTTKDVREEYSMLSEKEKESVMEEYSAKHRRDWFEYKNRWEHYEKERKEVEQKKQALVNEWSKYQVSYPDWQKSPVNDEEVRVLLSKKQTLLKAERERLLCEYNHLCVRIKDAWYYFKLRLKYSYTTISNDSMGYKMNLVGWYTSLYEHPEYYNKWRGTFFDEQHRLVSEELIYRHSGYTVRNFRITEDVSRHRYHTLYGVRFMDEDLSDPNGECSMFRESLGVRLGDDEVLYYVGYCDAFSYTEDGARLHLIDPDGEAFFENITVPPEEAQKAVGRMCMLGYAYNYFDKKARFMELQILPYTLTEKLGDYHLDTVTYCDNSVHAVGRLNNEQLGTDFILC